MCSSDLGDVVIHGLKVKDDRGLDFLKAESVVAESDWISLVKDAINGTNSFNFKKIALNNADVQVITYKGDSTANFIKFIELFDDGKPRDPKKPLFKMAASIEIHNSKLSIINQNSEGDAGKWLVGTSVNMSIPSLKIAGPDINADLQNLSFTTERWGKTHKVERFAGLFSLTNTALSFKELVFDTDHSLLKGDISFNLDEKTKWQEFNNRVIWDLKFEWMRWAGSVSPVISPIMRLRDTPMSRGRPVCACRSGRWRMSWVLCWKFLPKPMPGSNTMHSKRMPAAWQVWARAFR